MGFSFKESADSTEDFIFCYEYYEFDRLIVLIRALKPNQNNDCEFTISGRLSTFTYRYHYSWYARSLSRDVRLNKYEVKKSMIAGFKFICSEDELTRNKIISDRSINDHEIWDTVIKKTESYHGIHLLMNQ